MGGGSSATGAENSKKGGLQQPTPMTPFTEFMLQQQQQHNGSGSGVFQGGPTQATPEAMGQFFTAFQQELLKNIWQPTPGNDNPPTNAPSSKANKRVSGGDVRGGGAAGGVGTKPGIETC